VVGRGGAIGGGGMGGGAMGGGVMEEGGVGWGGGGGAGVARGRKGHGARGGGWGSAARAVRLCVWRANAWRPCGVEGGSSHPQIFPGARRYRVIGCVP